MIPDIALVLTVLGVTIVLFFTEALRVDVIAIAIMVALPWLGLVEPAEAFSALASNAVVAGTSETKIIGLVSAVVGVISAFMQNIGPAALFLTALLCISKKTKTPTSRLVMPMGFAAILGGTLTLAGSGPLIILNDLRRQRGRRRTVSSA